LQEAVRCLRMRCTQASADRIEGSNGLALQFLAV
jgi:hypothetical protein